MVDALGKSAPRSRPHRPVFRLLILGVEVGGGDGLQRLGVRHAELRREAGHGPAAHAVDLHRVEVVTAHHRLAWGQFHHQRLQPSQRVGQGDDAAPSAAAHPRPLAGKPHQFGQGVGARATKFVSLAEGFTRLRAHEAAGKRRDHVADVHRGKTGFRPGQRHDRKHPLQLGEGIEKVVFGAEHHRGPKNSEVDPGLRLERRLAVALGTQIHRRPFGIGPERAHVYHAAHALLRAGGGDAARQIDMRAGEVGAVGLAAPALQNAHEVDHGVAPGHQFGQLGVIMHIDLDHIDQRQLHQMTGALTAAGGHGDEMIGQRQGVDQAAANETAAADDENVLLLHESS